MLTQYNFAIVAHKFTAGEVINSANKMRRKKHRNKIITIIRVVYVIPVILGIVVIVIPEYNEKKNDECNCMEMGFIQTQIHTQTY